MSSSKITTPVKKKRAAATSSATEEPDKWALFELKRRSAAKIIRNPRDPIAELLQEFDDQNNLTQEVGGSNAAEAKEAEATEAGAAVTTISEASSLYVDPKYNAARIELLKAEFYEAEYY